ncbi:MAG TPA: TlpA disulfide reductase family protein [Acetobacteraceae bacterium]|nr:TlpA disulfide reductase family protein [Acetobacteraceae bacterium]
MMPTRRGLLAAGTVAALLGARKPGRAWAAELAKLAQVTPPRPAPETPFTTADGASRRIADYAGKVLLVNLWATWCAPCVAELPSLAGLARRAAERILVLPVSSDRGGAKVVEAFYASHGITGLPVLIDTDAALMHALGVRGLPTTYVIDAASRIVGKEEGGMNWDTAAAVDAVRALAGTGQA